MQRHKQAIKLLFIIIALAGIIISIGYSSRRKSTTAANRLTFAPTRERLERGRYIVEGPAHCFQCHSEVDWKNPGAQPVQGRKAGGTIFVEEGMQWLVAPNISPDVETGAGSWTDEQFARAIREGIGHDGRRLFPMMAYMNFRNMSDEDLKAIYAYLRTLTLVQHRVDNTEVATACSICRGHHGHGERNESGK